VLLGLEGRAPDRTDPDVAPARRRDSRKRSARTQRHASARVFEATDLLFLSGQTLPHHSNALRLQAFDASGAVLDAETYYSVGGGFSETASTPGSASSDGGPPLPYRFTSAAELLALGARDRRAIWEIVLANECVARPESVVRA
jgi:L-serine dehydratase